LAPGETGERDFHQRRCGKQFAVQSVVWVPSGEICCVKFSLNLHEDTFDAVPDHLRLPY
jgi:hypothetical protein